VPFLVFTAELLWAIIKAQEIDKTVSLKEKKKIYKKLIQLGLPALTIIFVAFYFTIATIYYYDQPN
jgi:hypothetical protein